MQDLVEQQPVMGRLLTDQICALGAALGSQSKSMCMAGALDGRPGQ
jgi:hypothetical protein